MRTIPSFLASVAFLIPLAVSAHGSGTPFDTVVGDYRFEISASTVGVRPNEEAEFHFELFRKNADGNLEYARFDEMTVTLSDDTGEVFEGEFPPVPGNVLSMNHVFLHAGTYAMHVLYESEGKAVAEATVEIPVSESAGMLGRIISFIEIGGVILVVIIAAGMSAWQYGVDRRY